MSFENRVKASWCPRGCGGKIMSGHQSKYNARSPVDNKVVCVQCYIDDLYRSKGVEL